MNCSVKAYEGGEAYAYLVACADDENVAAPLSERLAARGLRLWFASGESESTGKRLKQLGDCAACIVLLSENSVSNHICREELTNAIWFEKPVIIIQLGNAPLSPAMRLQMERCTVIHSEPIPDESLTDALTYAGALAPCMGEPRFDIVMQPYGSAPKRGGRVGGIHIPEWDKSFVPKSSTQTTLKEFEEKKLGKTIRSDIHAAKPKDTEDDEPGTVILPSKELLLPAIVSLSTGEIKEGMFGETSVGRIWPPDPMKETADLLFMEKCSLLSRLHFRIGDIDGIHTVTALHQNGVAVNGYRDLSQGESMQVGETALVRVPMYAQLKNGLKPDNQALFLIAFGSSAQELRQAKGVAWLESVETGEIRSFYQGSFEIGQEFPWKSGAMTAGTISRNHATLELEDGCCKLSDHSLNGTYVNERLLHNESAHLQSGDVIRFEGNGAMHIKAESFIFRYIGFPSQDTYERTVAVGWKDEIVHGKNADETPKRRRRRQPLI